MFRNYINCMPPFCAHYSSRYSIEYFKFIDGIFLDGFEMAYDLLSALHGIEGGLFRFDRDAQQFLNSSSDGAIPLLFSSEERRQLEKTLKIASHRNGFVYIIRVRCQFCSFLFTEQNGHRIEHFCLSGA